MAVASGAYKKSLEGGQQPKQVLVKIDRVTKKFDETMAVDDVSLQIHKGEIFALLGGSGCGKSTLLRMLAGFERPTEGRILPRRRGHHRHAALRTADQHDVPVLRAVSAHDRGAEHRLRPQAGQAAQGRNRGPRGRDAEAGADEPVRQAQAAPAVRRPASARGTGPLTGENDPSCCCSTSQWAHWTRNCVRRCSWNWWKSSSASA